MDPASAPEDVALSYWPDRPITRPEEDRLSRSGFANALAATILNRPDPSPLVIGLYGAWGTGKTSTLRLVEDALARDQGAVVVWFNPWYFGSQAAQTTAFFTTLADALGKSLTSGRERVGKVLRRLGEIVSLGKEGAGGQLKDWGQRLSSVQLDELRERVSALLTEAHQRVVVIVDDIDRLDHDEIFTLFTTVKLAADFQHVTYLLAFDDEMVAQSLAARYGGGGPDAGREFLEKIVQVPLRLPAVDPLELRRMAFEGIDTILQAMSITLKDRDVQEFVLNFARAFECRLRTPRLARRYSNAVLFALPSLRGEVNTLDQLLIEGVQVFYPKLYAAIRSEPAVFLEDPGELDSDRKRAERQARVIDAALEGFTETERRAAKRLLEELFPRTGSVGYRADWDSAWARQKRICSRDYFDRYFRYGVPNTDVSDIGLAEFLESLPGDIEGGRRRWQALLADGQPAERLIQKLRQQEATILPERAEALIALLANSAAELPRKLGLLGDLLSASGQAAMLVRALLERIPDEGRRFDVARSLVQDAESLTFAAECLGWMRALRDDVPGVLREEQLAELEALMATRVVVSAAQGWLVDVHGREAPRLLALWSRADGQAVQEYLREKITEEPGRVVGLLSAYASQPYSGTTGAPSRLCFERNSYDRLVAVCDANAVAGALDAVFGDHLDPTGMWFGEDVPDDLVLANQFLRQHSDAARELAAGGSTAHESS